jgi:Uma2 family endonuclease
MSVASIATESRRLEEWEVELAEVRAMTEREMENLVTENDTPVDNILSEKQQRLLTEPLYSAWAGPEKCAPDHRAFLALANVGLFYALRQPPLVPDVMLALDIPGLGPDLSQKGNRSYFVWVQDGKSPAVVVEIVSNQEGGEDGGKLRQYEAIGIPYYVIFDPWRLLSDRMLRIYQFAGVSQGYIEQVGGLLDAVGLGLSLWQGEYEGTETLWLRWADREGRLIPTGAELARREQQRAMEAEQRSEQERQRAEESVRQAEQERQRAEESVRQAEQERQRAERLAARLRELGIEPPA